VPATLPPLLRSSCLHAPPPLGSPLASPHHPLQPRAQPPQPATRSIIRTRPAFASTRSQRSCRRCTQLTSEAERRQLRHPCETRCQRRCPMCSDVIACTHRCPSQTPFTRYSPVHNHLSRKPATSSAPSKLPAFASTRSQHKPGRRTQRTTEVQRRQLRHPSETRRQLRRPSCSDVIVCTHLRPSARPSQSPHHPLQPSALQLRRATRNIIHALPEVASTSSQRSRPPMHAAYRPGPATSAASSVRGSVPATLPQLLGSH
jgi:hypothetical protein